MKNRKSLSLIFILAVAALALIIAGCGGSSSDGGGSTNFSNAEQASAATESVAGVTELAFMTDYITAVAMQNVPDGYAPSRGKKLNTEKIADIDPELKAVVDKMMAHLQLPTVQSSVAKAHSLVASRAATVDVVADCDGGGTFSIHGEDSSVANSYNEFTIDISYAACRDTIGTTYGEVSGSMHLYHKFMLDWSSATANLTINKLIITEYQNSVEMNKGVLDGAFEATGNGASGSSSANGSFELISNEDDVSIKYSFSGVNNSWSISSDATGTTSEDTSNGTFTLSAYRLSAPSNSQALKIGVSGFKEKEFQSIEGDKDEWTNGTFSVDFSPNVPGCFEGRFVIATAESTPVHTPYGSSCPTSGTVSINNATIEFGKPAGIMVTVTVNGASTELASCDDLGSGGMCQ